MSPHRCRFCGHHPHPDGRCAVERVTGPASTQGRNLYADNGNGKPELVGFDHTGRTVTPCGCTDYLPTLNGVTA